MIRSFRHRGLKRVYQSGERSRLAPALVERVEEVLGLLDVAEAPKDMNLPGYRLHPLKGDRKGFWSVTVSGNWRIVFRFHDGHACDVDLVDYH